jgi:hypothetical protein
LQEVSHQSGFLTADDLAPAGLEKRAGFVLWMAKARARTH